MIEDPRTDELFGCEDNMKIKSRMLTISTAIDVLIGILLFFVIGFSGTSQIILVIGRLKEDFSDGIGFLFVWIPLVGIAFLAIAMLVAFAFIAFELFTAWISYKTNKLSWTITHIVALLFICFFGYRAGVRGSAAVESFFANWIALAGLAAAVAATAALRLLGHFSQKKLTPAQDRSQPDKTA